MKEKALAQSLHEQSKLILDAIEGKAPIQDVAKDFIKHIEGVKVLDILDKVQELKRKVCGEEYGVSKQAEKPDVDPGTEQKNTDEE